MRLSATRDASYINQPQTSREPFEIIWLSRAPTGVEVRPRADFQSSSERYHPYLDIGSRDRVIDCGHRLTLFLTLLIDVSIVSPSFAAFFRANAAGSATQKCCRHSTGNALGYRLSRTLLEQKTSRHRPESRTTFASLYACLAMAGEKARVFWACDFFRESKKLCEWR